MTQKSLITTTLKATEKNEAKVLVSVSQSLIKEERAETVAHMASGVTIKGFRKGNAPLDLVEGKLDPQKVLDHLLDHLFPKILNQVLKDHDLKPLSYPKAKVIRLPADEAWEFELTVSLRPTITLGDYKKIISKANSDKTLTPKKDDKPKSQDEQDNDRLQKVFAALLEEIKLDVPPSLIDDEVNHSLSRLLQQTQTLGLTLEDYLKSVGKTPETMREEYAKAAEESIKLELILDAISADLKLDTTPKEIEDMITASGDEETKKRLDTPEQRRHISAILKQRKTLDAILKL
jgi:FKBP-type peptidyl-prolyl cis-trans isomerase (trigger factor)